MQIKKREKSVFVEDGMRFWTTPGVAGRVGVGGPLQSLQQTSTRECGRACLKNPSCVAFNRLLDANTCQLLSSRDCQPQTQPNAIYAIYVAGRAVFLIIEV